MKHYKLLPALAFVAAILITVSCNKVPSDLTKAGIIPKPVSITSTGDYFTIKDKTAINIGGNSEELMQTGRYLAEKLQPVLGFTPEVTFIEGEPGPGNIFLTLAGQNDNPGDESYELSITKQGVKLSAKSPAGLFRGIQTIRQLLPAKSDPNAEKPVSLKIAGGTISDYPEYSYRGVMLDVARHFFSAEDVKQYIDYIAFYKMNVMHLHLTDDQGWRIEIKSWPDLTKIGSTTQVGGGKGGFYTQEQYTDIVKYAQERYITIIPEIEMPGHSNAALASYPELNCNGKATQLYTGTAVGFSTFCTKKEITYKFIDDVFGELASITPGPYIHMGGDESQSTLLEDYIPFVNRVQDIVAAHGKKVLGWDEIALSTLKPNTIAQNWANRINGKKAVDQGAKILMSPASKAYLDMQYDSTTNLGLHWAGYIDVDTAYLWDPAKLIPGIGKENIIGVEAPLWAETLTTLDEIEFMAFPRLPGYAEIGWTAPAMRNWDEYKLRLAEHGDYFDAMGINYFKSPKVPWPDKQ